MGTGESFGRYELLSRIAIGGMAEIFLARETGLAGFERLVVVKRVLPGLSEDMDFIDMFLDEARLAARLTHPNIVHIYELSEEQGAYYIAMEYIPGGDLHELGKRRQGQLLPLADSLHIIGEVCAGLQFAHALAGPDGEPLGVVHRDVTPKNVLLSVDGVVKVVDFGIAKARAKLSVTRPGDIKGTFSYMSPEQARGEQVDRRADIYAVGALTYRLITGTPAYPQIGDSLLSAVRASQFVRPRKINPNIPPQIEDIILRAMAFEPKDRFPTCGALRRELSDVMRQISLHADADSIADIVRTGFPDVLGITAPIDKSETTEPRPQSNLGSPMGQGLAIAGPEESTGLVSLPEELPDLFDADEEPRTFEDLIALGDDDQTDMLMLPEEMGVELVDDSMLEEVLGDPTRVALPNALNRLQSTPRAVFGGDLQEPATEPAAVIMPPLSPGSSPVPQEFQDVPTVAESGFVGPAPTNPQQGISSAAPPPWSVPSGAVAPNDLAASTPTATPILRNRRRAKEKKKRSRRGLFLIIGGFTAGVFLITIAIVLIAIPPSSSATLPDPNLDDSTAPNGSTLSPELLSSATSPDHEAPDAGSEETSSSRGDASVSSNPDVGLASTMGEPDEQVEPETPEPPPPVLPREGREVSNGHRSQKGRTKTPRTGRGGSPTKERTPRAKGYLTVFTVPSSKVYIGSRLLGNSPIAKREVPAGRFTLKLVSPNRPNKTVRVTVKSGETTRVRQRL